MRKLLLGLALALLLAGCGQSGTTEEPPEETGDTDEYEALIAATPVAQVEGEAVSPDGRFEVRAEGASGEYVSGVQSPEFLQIVDRETGEVLWQDMGWPWQSVLWSPEGGFLALAYSAQTWCTVTVFEAENWTSWEFTLPDGSPIPEYTFLPEDWGVWQSEGSLDLTIGQGGDAGEQRYYTCTVEAREGKLKGIVWEESHETLPGSYDFDHDGEPEIMELVTVAGDEDQDTVGWYELRVRTGDNRLYWGQSFAGEHPGWGSCFACRVDGEDYLLRYLPTMYQGYATYTYELFFLDETGEEQVVREGSVSFDINFGSPMHDEFDPAAVAAFLEEVHGLLEDSELLLTTEGRNFRSGGPGSDFKDDLAHWTDNELYDENKSLEENIRDIGAYWEESRTA
ncbi:hypothetical protein [uncultured Oscillibacter sp.]|jgi:hypothetical protein|uniref:hypothetical protein n=1 Tax=uncultured Oscillibacter sp. TaxID=876091 RepID=UPI0025EBF8D1|nr:hypothetical protein [uncultured Oscillibacter sp.]